MDKPTSSAQRRSAFESANNNTSEEMQNMEEAMVQETIAKATCPQCPSYGSDRDKLDSRRQTAKHVQANTCTTRTQMKTSKSMHKTTSSEQRRAALESAISMPAKIFGARKKQWCKKRLRKQHTHTHTHTVQAMVQKATKTKASDYKNGNSSNEEQQKHAQANTLSTERGST
jgi:hypothetical protein